MKEVHSCPICLDPIWSYIYAILPFFWFSRGNRWNYLIVIANIWVARSITSSISAPVRLSFPCPLYAFEEKFLWGVSILTYGTRSTIRPNIKKVSQCRIHGQYCILSYYWSESCAFLPLLIISSCWIIIPKCSPHVKCFNSAKIICQGYVKFSGGPWSSSKRSQV